MRESDEALPVAAVRYAPERAWEEDFTHENGNYCNVCRRCEQAFFGHKRRRVCKECATNECMIIPARTHVTSPRIELRKGRA